MPKKSSDIVEFQRLEKYEDGEPDYMVGPSFPREPEHDLRHLIEYRIKLLLKEEILLEPSESQLVATCCKISCKSPNLSMPQALRQYYQALSLHPQKPAARLISGRVSTAQPQLSRWFF